MSQIPRPGLYNFLERCRQLFPRIVMFTTVKEALFRGIAKLLVEDQFAPAWFADIEYITWIGTTKNLAFVGGARPEEVLLVDDFEHYVHPGQEKQWVQIDHFDFPYSSNDDGLLKALAVLESAALLRAAATERKDF